MITKIPQGQMCQAFDPMMFLPEKTMNIIGATENANPSCEAPAFVYLEGTHGKKFLCDFHYYYEINMTRTRANRSVGVSWESVQEFIIDERERVKDTFAKNITTTETLGNKCSIYSGHKKDLVCNADALVKVNQKTNDPNAKNSMFYCNFHFRKNYYRHYSNGVRFEDMYEILDERYRMKQTISEESLSLECV
jgi:hypothetical protein